MRPVFGIALMASLMVLPACQRYAAVRERQVEKDLKAEVLRRDNEAGGQAGVMSQAAPAPSADQAQGYAGQGQSQIGRLGDAYTPIRGASSAMIIRTGTASLGVDSLETAIGRVRNLAIQVGGYIANSDIQAVEGGVRSAMIEIRVPSDRFDQLVNGLSPLGKLEHVNVTAQDVGEEFTDISARVLNGHKLEARLIELIATRTGKLSDVLEIERELARVREEIERMEGRLRYLEAHAAVSSLSIQIHEPAPIVGDVGSLAVLAEAFRQAWRNSVGFAAAGIAAMGTLLPVALLGLLGVVGLRKAWRRRLA
jgi:hypothetical protein